MEGASDRKGVVKKAKPSRSLDWVKVGVGGGWGGGGSEKIEMGMGEGGLSRFGCGGSGGRKGVGDKGLGHGEESGQMPKKEMVNEKPVNRCTPKGSAFL